MQTVKQAIRDEASALGFDAVGFCAAAPAPGAAVGLAAFLEAGRQGDMDWLARDPHRRSSPVGLWPEARSIVVVAANYGPAEDPRGDLDHPDRGVVSVYARGRDYHDVLKKRLKRLGRWLVDSYGGDAKVFVDTAPVMEKPLAQRAGLGWQGKHTNLVSRRYGSWLFLGELFTTLDLPPDPPEADHCGSCDACCRACPTDALAEPYRIDPTRCISYLTIEHKGEIADDLRRAMGNRIYGCDDCLAACPWNKFAAPAAEPAFAPRPETTAPRLAELAGLDDAAFRQRFAGSPIKRTGRDRFVRNVLIALGNGATSEAKPAVEKLSDDGSSLVRSAAAWALGRMARQTSKKCMAGSTNDHLE